MKRLIAILILLPGLLSAQDFHLKNVGLHMTNGVLVSVKSSLINRGQIHNEGALLVSGNWVNTGVYRDELGSVNFNGSDLQYISQGNLPMKHVIFSNGRKHISENLLVSGSMEMEEAQVFVPSGSAVYIEEGATLHYQSGDRVIGALFMTGNDITFPIGTPEKMLPIRLKLPQDEVLQIGVVVKPGLLSPKIDNTISTVADYYWQLITPEAYKGASITLNFQDAKFLQKIKNARVGEAQKLNDVIRDAGSIQYSGSIVGGAVTTENARGPFLTVAKKYGEGEKPSINVLNLLSPNNDGYNDFLLIENIEAYPDNKVSIYDRWGLKLYEVAGYDNNKIQFIGECTEGASRKLEEGSYFYVVASGAETLATGFIELVR